ncbi:MAG: alpha/beta hydrolase [Hyphomicrobiaceae bacterium]|nr:alpha/beta hydrolase [Hyphomicrobiaceae bacterium]
MIIEWNGKVAETPDLAINYVRAGHGEPVVFLHGWPEWKRSWLHNLPVLADRFDCIAPDLRGFGRTVSRHPRNPEGSPPQLLAKDLRDLADALGLEKFAIVSHDVGSFVAQQFALAWPERVTRLFFFNCAYPGIGQRWGAWQHFPETWYQQFHQKDFAAALVGSSRETCRIYFRHFLTHWSHQKAAFEPYLEEWVDNFMSNGNLQGGFDWYIGVSRFRRRMMQEGALQTPKIKAPTYFLWGAHDPVLKWEFTDKIGDYFESYTLEKAEEAGHFVHFEVPQLANERLSAFLSDT